MDYTSLRSNDSLFNVTTATPGFRQRLKQRLRQRFRVTKRFGLWGARKRVKEELKELFDFRPFCAAVARLGKDLKSQGSKLKGELRAISKLPTGSKEQLTAFWELIKKIIVKIRGALRWVAEKLNLLADHHLKGDNIKGLTDEELLRMHNSTVRAISGATTGILISGAITVGCIIFAVPLAINVWQLVVSILNHRRVAREMKERQDRKGDAFRAAQKRFHRLVVNRPGFHVVLGCFIKVCLLSVSIGISGFDNIVESFATEFGDTGDVDASHVAHAAAAAAAAKGSFHGHAASMPVATPGQEEISDVAYYMTINALEKNPALYQLAEGGDSSTSLLYQAGEKIAFDARYDDIEDIDKYATLKDLKYLSDEKHYPPLEVAFAALWEGIEEEISEPYIHGAEILTNEYIDKKKQF